MRNTASRLGRYVPRLASEWNLDAPGDDWQALDSTLVFVDLSGFTQLSERLARRGRIGAEELTDVLDHVFGAMLEVAYARGGSLAKFGGDALLLHFRGDEHALQAACAAVEMRAALRMAGQLRTSVGRVPLRMSVGVHSGLVHVFRVGTSHHELVVAGPAATHVAAMEALADAGEILLSADTARLLPASALGAAKGDGVLLRWRRSPAPVSGIRRRRGVDPAVVAGCVPVALRSVLGQGAIEPEHRLATVAFLKFTGVDSILAEHGPPSVAAALHEVISTAQEAAERAGVTFLATDVDKDGGKIILVTGVPLTQDDDDGRMLRAVRDIVDTPLRLTVRAGVHRGHVFAGAVGSIHRATFTIIGDTVNLAARLMSAAPPHGVLATPDVLDRSRVVFATEQLEPMRVKGKSQPVAAFAVGRKLGTRTHEVARHLPFVGRQHERDALVEAVAAAEYGNGSVLTVVGEAGLGKTRLVEEALSAVSAGEIIRVNAEQAGSTSPYRGFRDPIRRLLGVARADQPTMAGALRAAVADRAPALLPMLPLIGDLAHVDVPATAEVERIELRFRPDRTADVLVELLEACVAGPIVLVFDDAQWMDSASISLVERLCSVVAERPWCCVVARRPDGGGLDPQPARRLELKPLEAVDASAIVIAATNASPLRPHEVELIVDRAAGSPLFLGEILEVAGGKRVDELPESLDAVVNTEIDALPRGPRRMMRYASVLGRSFRLPVLRELLVDEGLDIDASTRRQLARFLEFDDADRAGFRHEVHRQVAYEGMTFRRRRELHGRAGRITERMAGDAPEAVSDLLSMHYSLAQEHRLAWTWARVAGDRARERYANREAATHYVRAIEAARRLDDLERAQLVDVWRLLGDVHEQSGMFEDAIDAYRRAAALADAPAVRADLLWRRSLARMHLGGYRVALAEASKGLRLLDGADDAASRAMRARLIALQALLRQAQQRAIQASVFARRAIDEALAAPDDYALARAYLVDDWANRMLGVGDSGAPGERALEIYERLGDLDGVAKASNNLGGIRYFEGRWDEAVQWYRKALDAYRRSGNDAAGAVTASNLGELLVSRGALDEAEPMLRDAVRILRASGDLDGVLFAEIQLGRLMLERGDAHGAIAHLGAVRAQAAALGQLGHLFEAAMHLASAHAAIGEDVISLSTLDEALAELGSVNPVFQPTWARVRAEALAAGGRWDQARDEVGNGLASAREQGLSYEEGLLLRRASELDRAQGVEPSPEVIDAMEALFARLNVTPSPMRSTDNLAGAS